EDGRAGVALFLRGVPIGGVGGWPELLDVVRTCLGFLQAENVRLLGVEVIEKILTQHGAQTVHVPGNQFHHARLLGNGGQTNSISRVSMRLMCIRGPPAASAACQQGCALHPWLGSVQASPTFLRIAVAERALLSV